MFGRDGVEVTVGIGVDVSVGVKVMVVIVGASVGVAVEVGKGVAGIQLDKSKIIKKIKERFFIYYPWFR